MRIKRKLKDDDLTKTIWLIINSQKHGPYTVLEVIREIENGRIHLIDEGSYDGIKWQPLGQMTEFCPDAIKPPIRPEFHGEPTLRIKVADLVAKFNSSPEMKKEQEIKTHDRLVSIFTITVLSSVLLLVLYHITQSDEIHILGLMENKSSRSTANSISTSSPATVLPNKTEIPSDLPSYDIVQGNLVQPSDEPQEPLPDSPGPVKEKNYTRYPSTGEIEYSQDGSGQPMDSEP